VAGTKTKGAEYDSHREKMAERMREQSAKGRDIGSIPEVADSKRKAKCRKSLKKFATTYFPRRFKLKFGEPHEAAIRMMEACVRDGGQFALAMPRASGKTTLAEVAVLWAVLNGYRKFVVLLCATLKHATRRLKQLTRELEANDLLLADYPEACYPVRALERSAHRAKGQLHNGKPTRIELTAEGLVLAAIPGAACAGAVVQVGSMEGAIRGLNVSGPDGEPLRPDLVLLDDCQTREVAKSPVQVSDRESVITDDVLGLAGPDTTISALMLCTVIYQNDLSDRFLSHEKHPEWQGQRTRMIESFPTDKDLWDEYSEVRRESLRSGDKGRQANEFYKAHRERMDAGGKVSWEGRVRSGDVSALQSAMNEYLANPRGFYAEYQNDPRPQDTVAGAKELRAADLAARVSGVPQLEVPVTCTRLTAFVDVGGELLWYAVCAWNESFGGSVIDYGAWPRQGRTMFAANDPRPGMSDAYPGRTEAQRVFAGLSDLLPLILGRRYRRAHGGEELQVERCLIDAGWQTDAVFQAITASPLSASLYASKGVGRSTTQVGVARWRSRPGERSGHHWRLTLGEAKRGRQVQFDPDAWKSVIYNALTVPLGGSTGLSLFGKSAGPHEMLSEHLAAEYSEPAMLKGDTFDKWQLRPDRSDNHLLDCVVGCAVAASVCGLLIPTGDQPAKVELPPKPIKLSELQKQKQQQQGARR
jgi:hypothetical protein